MTTTPATDALRLLTVPEVSAETGLTERALRYLIAQGALPVVRIGRTVRVRRADLLAWLDAHTDRGAAR